MSDSNRSSPRSRGELSQSRRGNPSQAKRPQPASLRTNFATMVVIDTTQRDQTALALLVDNQLRLKMRQPVRAQELPKLLSDLLAAANLNLTQIEAVAVLRGPGSYTGTRIGVTTANILGWLWKIPIIAVPGSNFDQAVADLQRGYPFPITELATAEY